MKIDWIPTEDRLPNLKPDCRTAFVLVTYRCPAFGNDPCISTALYSVEYGFSVDDAEVDREMIVDAWMPLPPPFEINY